MRTVVICLHGSTLGIVGIRVERIKMGADALYRRKILCENNQS